MFLGNVICDFRTVQRSECAKVGAGLVTRDLLAEVRSNSLIISIPVRDCTSRGTRPTAYVLSRLRAAAGRRPRPEGCWKMQQRDRCPSPAVRERYPYSYTKQQSRE